MKIFHWLLTEIKKVWLLAFFFAIAFLYILLILKLYLKTYAIDSFSLSKAIVGGLFAAKAILIVDKTPFVNHFSYLPRIVPLLYRSLLYSFVVILFGNIEGTIHAYSETQNWGNAWSSFLSHRDNNRFWATNLCILIVFLIYNTLVSLEKSLGKGWLLRFFFHPPQADVEIESTSNLIKLPDSPE